LHHGLAHETRCRKRAFPVLVKVEPLLAHA
jgi:hypothetical protein